MADDQNGCDALIAASLFGQCKAKNEERCKRNAREKKRGEGDEEEEKSHFLVSKVKLRGEI